MTPCRNPECARLRDELRAALIQAQAECDLRRRTVTTGGPPAPYTATWTNRTTGRTL
jgi:hypothetical protein